MSRSGAAATWPVRTTSSERGDGRCTNARDDGRSPLTARPPRTTARGSSLNLGPDSTDLEFPQDLVYQPAIDPYAARALLDALVERRRDSAEIGAGLLLVGAALAALGATRAAVPVLIG